jgi:radical SAM superfamily enzyme YgiQ (UPF0313 family)
MTPKAKWPILFIQLPQLDNDISLASENIHLAAHYLKYAACRAVEKRFYRFSELSPRQEMASQSRLAEMILRNPPRVLIATLYLWNIERTLDLCGFLKQKLPGMRIAAGGPEVAADHPFLFKRNLFDVAAIGEGEWVFPKILQAFRRGSGLDYCSLIRRDANRWRRGSLPVPEIDLQAALPSSRYPGWQPDANGMAYLEASRGCPMRCAYCRYPHFRRRLSFLPIPDIIGRVRILRQRGAREIRFVDPTFNARPDFDQVVAALAACNRRRRLKFFAELKAEDLSSQAPAQLAEAGFAEIEVGLQSRNPAVMQTIHRPTNLAALDQGVRRLARAGIKVTLDLMYGLPGQSLGDVSRDLRKALEFDRIRIQCMQTLLLPGTELRRRRKEFGLAAADLPPYGVTATPRCPTPHMRRVEHILARHHRLAAAFSTARFVGRVLPDLFADHIQIVVGKHPLPTSRAGRSIRQAVILEGNNIYAHQAMLAAWIHSQIQLDRHALWQFILAPDCEEQLDLLDALMKVLRSEPSHLLDRYAACQLKGGLASRQLFIQLAPHRRYSRSWVRAAESLLSRHFA